MKKVTQRKKVTQMNIYGNKIAKFKSITAAANAVGISRQAIQSVLRGVNHTAAGWKWKYTKDT